MGRVLNGGYTMKKQIIIIVALTVVAIILITGMVVVVRNNNNSINSSKNSNIINIPTVTPSENGITFTTIDNDFEAFTEIYHEEYQNAIHDQVEQLKASKRYNLENPLIIANPYNTVTNGVYVYFETEEKEKVQYVVSSEGYQDFIKNVYAGEEKLSTKHEWMLIGLIPEKINTITINTLNSKDEIQNTITFTYMCPKAASEYNVTQLEIEKGDSTQALSDGLYAVLGNQYENGDTEQSQSYIGIYDNEGVLRCEIPCVSYKANRFLMDEQGMYFSVSGGRICRMDNTGYVNAVYKLGDLELHHDNVFGSNNDLIVLGTDKKTGNIEDIILSIDITTKKIKTIIDLKELFPEYYKMAKKPESAEYLDWMHLNSISFIDDDSFIVSARETSTLIKIDNVYTNPTVDYMIGSENFWKGTGYENLLLKQEGDFSLQSGQHTITYQEDASLKTGEYYLYMYNNNNTTSKTRPDYDWSADDSYKNANLGKQTSEVGSLYYKYLVNTNTRTFSLVDEIEVDYSGYVSSTQEYKDNLIIASGSKFTAYEYDKDHKLIQKLHIAGDILIYRVLKYDFVGYWFAE